MNLSEINDYTTTHYNFQVLDWDNCRGDCGFGTRWMKKIQYLDPSCSSQYSSTNVEFRRKNLSLMKVEEIAKEFYEIIAENQNVTNSGLTLSATVICVQNTTFPQLFVIGKIVQEAGLTQT